MDLGNDQNNNKTYLFGYMREGEVGGEKNRCSDIGDSDMRCSDGSLTQAADGGRERRHEVKLPRKRRELNRGGRCVLSVRAQWCNLENAIFTVRTSFEKFFYSEIESDE